MSRGRYLSLEEARKKGNLDRFAKEHPSEGNLDAVLGTIERMAKTPESTGQTSNRKRRGED